MGRISQDDIARVREATDIVALVGEYVQLKQRGRDFWGNCPFHNEKTPSFKASAQTQTWHCFGCGEGGDAFKFLMLKEQFDFPEAVRYLANKAHIPIIEESGGLPSGYRARLFACADAASDFYHTQLMRGKSDGAASARSYLASRGFGGEIPKKWNLGYAPGSNTLISHLKSQGFSEKEMIDTNLALQTDRGALRDRFYNRVIFPIHDLQGRTIAFGGRVIGKGEPKYINTSNCSLFSKRSNLFGIDRAKSKITTSGYAIVVEGYTDVIAMHEAGFDNTVATLGTALTPEHVGLLTRFASKIIYLFDGDAAGQKAADRASELISATSAPESGTRQVMLFVAVIPDNLDPVDFIEANGRDEMESLLKDAEPLLRFVIDRRISDSDLSTPESKSIALKSVLSPLAPIKGSILADEYINYIADIFKIDFESVRRELAKIKPQPISTYLKNEGEGYSSIVQGNEGKADQNGKGPKSQIYQIPTQGVKRWEAQIVAAYALYPSLRMTILHEMKKQDWADGFLKELLEIMSDFDTGTKPSELVSACMEKYPESELLWNITLAGLEEKPEAAQTIKLMLKEHQKAYIEDMLHSMEHDVKYNRELSQQDREELFKKITAMQKKLSELRKS